MARDKCYMDVSQDTTIRMAYEWYQHHGSKKDRMLSAYYMGVVQQQAGNSLEAALAFREAEPLAEELADYRQLSLIEQHLSGVFARNYDHVRALEYAKKSLESAEMAEEKLMADYSMIWQYSGFRRRVMRKRKLFYQMCLIQTKTIRNFTLMQHN